MTIFFALHLILSPYFDVEDTRTRPSNVVNTRYSASPSNFPLGTSLIVVRAFALEADRLGSILSRVKPKILKLVPVFAVTRIFLFYFKPLNCSLGFCGSEVHASWR